MSLKEKATNPLQYDQDEIIWNDEGDAQSPIRRLMLEHLNPHLGNLAGKHSLDIGSGRGWLVEVMRQQGADALGIDSSERNVAAARQQYPDAHYERASLDDYPAKGQFDVITAVMVFEHVPDLVEGFTKVRNLLAPDGRFLLLDGDFDKFTKQRNGYSVELEKLSPGEVAARTDYGERAGVIYDIFRTVERTLYDAEVAGLVLNSHEPIVSTDWLNQEAPHHIQYGKEPLFQLFEFSAPS